MIGTLCRPVCRLAAGVDRQDRRSALGSVLDVLGFLVFDWLLSTSSDMIGPAHLESDSR